MSILVNKDSKVICQGLTGRQGSFHAEQCIDYGTQIVAGVTDWSCTDNIDANERKKIKKVLDSFGKTVYVDDESFIDMSTSISGSGPALSLIHI